MNNQEAPASSPPGVSGPSVSRQYTGQVKQSVSCVSSASRKGTIVAWGSARGGDDHGRIQDVQGAAVADSAAAAADLLGSGESIIGCF